MKGRGDSDPVHVDPASSPTGVTSNAYRPLLGLREQGVYEHMAGYLQFGDLARLFSVCNALHSETVWNEADWVRYFQSCSLLTARKTIQCALRHGQLHIVRPIVESFGRREYQPILSRHLVHSFVLACQYAQTSVLPDLSNIHSDQGWLREAVDRSFYIACRQNLVELAKELITHYMTSPSIARSFHRIARRGHYSVIQQILAVEG